MNARPHHAARAALAAVLAVALLHGCGGEGSGNALQETVLETRIAAIELEVGVRIGPAVCVSDADCRVLPMGSMACGGPSGFLAYSTRGTDEGALTQLSADHQRLSAQLAAQRQPVGPCIALLLPVPVCNRSAPLACRVR